MATKGHQRSVHRLTHALRPYWTRVTVTSHREGAIFVADGSLLEEGVAPFRFSPAHRKVEILVAFEQLAENEEEEIKSINH